MTTSTTTLTVRAALLAALLIGLAGCPAASDSTTDASTVANDGRAPSTTERLLHIESRFGDDDALFGDASYKIKRKKGETTKQFKVELENGTPGSTYEITLDGVSLGTLIVGVDGEGELEFEDDFPDGFVEPAAGATVDVGHAFTVTLEPLERVSALAAVISGAASGEVSFKKERLAGTTHRELEVEVEDASPGSYDVQLDGLSLGSMDVDDDGDGTLNFGGRGGDAFPDGFVDPSVGSILKIGDDIEVTLARDD